MKIGLALLGSWGIGYGTALYFSKQSINEYEDARDEIRDASRLGNKSYGLNFGYKTDSTIEDILDTGDLVFMQHVCYKSFSPLLIGKCYLSQKYKSLLTQFGYKQENWDSAGIIVRNREGAKVIFKYFSEVYDIDYDEFLKIPFFSFVSLRKMKTKDPAVGYMKREELSEEVKKENERSGIFDVIDINNCAVPWLYWKKTGTLKNDYKDKITLQDINTMAPKCLDSEKVKYSGSIIVRSNFSRQETQKY
ncbi:unnamed protein product [Blepharisma stoltei]|uniref:Uncharacterized protein n=1 Tax=Blepharisma stoltei TaxID=1481888 RepID=A0AAU9KLJ4_9CILI|nr:unnamed protein product [Blepharisma stoltei]